MPLNDIAYLQGLITDVATEQRQLHSEFKTQQQAHHRERQIFRVLGGVMAFSFLLAAVLLATSRTTLNSTERTLQFVRSCTVPDGECYKANRSGTVDFRQQLLGVIAIITDCDVSTDDLTKYRACVKKRTSLIAEASVEVNPSR